MFFIAFKFFKLFFYYFDELILKINNLKIMIKYYFKINIFKKQLYSNIQYYINMMCTTRAKLINVC